MRWSAGPSARCCRTWSAQVDRPRLIRSGASGHRLLGRRRLYIPAPLGPSGGGGPTREGNMAGRFEGKVAFITGAARGQGRAEAIRLAEGR